MGRKEEILERVRAIAEPVVAAEGLELIEVELGGAGGRQTLRLFIDRTPSPGADRAPSPGADRSPSPGADTSPSPGADRAPAPGAEKSAGVSLDDCSAVSRAVSAALDVEDPIAGAYDLEVSSPGLDRPLRKPEHFRKYAGEKVRVKTFGPVPECENRKTFVGRLLGYEDEKVVVDVDGKVFRVPHAQVSKANVEPVFDI